MRVTGRQRYLNCSAPGCYSPPFLKWVRLRRGGAGATGWSDFSPSYFFQTLETNEYHHVELGWRWRLFGMIPFHAWRPCAEPTRTHKRLVPHPRSGREGRLRTHPSNFPSFMIPFDEFKFTLHEWPKPGRASFPSLCQCKIKKTTPKPLTELFLAIRHVCRPLVRHPKTRGSSPHSWHFSPRQRREMRK